MDAYAVDPHRAYWESVLEERYDLRGTGFPDLPLSWNRWLYRQMRGSVDRLLTRNNLTSRIADASVLDIGSGVGHWLQYWTDRRAASLQGGDLTATAVKELRRRFPDVPMAAVDIGLPDPPFQGRYDVISMMAVLQHIADDVRWRQALVNLGALLADGGAGIIIDTLLVHRMWVDPKPEGGLSWSRSKAEWEDALADAGLVIVDRVPTTFTLAVGGDTAHAVTSRAWRRYWRVVQKITSGHEISGQVGGGLAYGVDQLLVRSGLPGVTSKTFLVRHRSA
jgi:SAM-dependent methyltransferase